LVVLGRDISDLKQVEEALRASEAQYRDLVQTANCIILRWGTDGTIRFMNTYGQRLFGFELGEILNQNVVGTIVPATETSGRDLPALMVDICQHPENYLFNENENICKNGERLWIVWANKPILDLQGNLVEILSVGTDATKRKRAEAALEASETKFRTIVENANDILFVINPEGVFTYLSPNLLYVTGYQPAELEGNPFVSLIYADDLPACLAAVQQVVVTGQRQSEIEYRIKYKDGNYHWQVSNLAPSQDGDGNLLIIGVARDITERKQVEETLRRSELKYRNIFENSQVGIGRTRLVDGLVLDANQRFAEIMGYGSATDLIYQRCSTEFYAIPEDRQQVLA
ncbi:MAG TPA: PAS domain S-box protein, partial [Candidatus Caenarcaniphilales bacterium]